MKNSFKKSFSYALSIALSKAFEESRNRKKLDYEKGSENVFADLGLPNAEELKAKTIALKKIGQQLLPKFP